MEIWLSKGNKDKIQIPVNPEEIGASGGHNFNDMTVVNGDEKTVLGGTALKEYSLATFFPKRNAPYVTTRKLLAPMDYVKKLEGWMKSGEPILLQVTTTNINTQVTIRNFEWFEQGGAVGDIDFTLDLKQYAGITFNKKAVSGSKIPDGGRGNNSSRPSSSKTKPGTYTVKRGDCLWNIAKKFYGDATKWPTIYKKNKSVVGKNPNLIYPGQKLVIP